MKEWGAMGRKGERKERKKRKGEKGKERERVNEGEGEVLKPIGG